MDYMRYHRYVVLMDGENRQFSLRNDSCKGHLKIETGNNKGALRCRVENLKPMQKNEYVYKLIFFGKKRERTIFAVIGSLNTGRSGTGESYFRFDPTDVDGQGHCFEDFSSVVVAAASLKNDKEPLHPVLSGSTGNEPETQEGDRAESSQPIQDSKESSSGEQTGMKNSGKELNAEEGTTWTEQTDPQPGESSPTQSNEEVSQPQSNSVRTFNSFYNKYLLDCCGYMARSADFYEKSTPFEEDQLQAKWRRVQDVDSLPLVSPGAAYFAGQYHHYLFGAGADENGCAGKYFIGVPGRFLEREIPDGGESGFVFWQPVKGSAREKGAYGYWIVSIDARTGDIMPAL